MKTCGLYIRVSTDRQAMVEEGSLKNQDQILTQHVEMKNSLGPDRWVIVDRYIDEGKSAKDTNRPAYQRMIEDVKQKKINAVVCLALSRISRSTRDLLDLVEFFQQNGVDFICLKEDVDTTSPMGRLLLTFMGALNQFEREQTGERTRIAIQARAERGLWNGGHLFGYDLDLNRKGSFVINKKEAEIVRFAFQTYLKVGSIIRTRQLLNEKGYLTKTYTSRRGKIHPASRFSNSSVSQLLTNVAYAGKKAIKKPIQESGSAPAMVPSPRLVAAVWPAIIDEETFNETQRLMALNKKSNNNGQVSNKHFYLLNGGIFYCHKCGGLMQGRNGHGHKGQKTYYYYACRGCGLKLPQAEVERTMSVLMAKAAQEDDILPRIVEKLNKKLKKSYPGLQTDKREKEDELRRVNQEAQTLLSKTDWVDKGKVFLDEELARLAGKRRTIENELASLQSELESVNNTQVNDQVVRAMLQESHQVFGDEMPPYKRKELLKFVAGRLEMSDKECRIAVDVQTAMRSQGAGGILLKDRSQELVGEPFSPLIRVKPRGQKP